MDLLNKQSKNLASSFILLTIIMSITNILEYDDFAFYTWAYRDFEDFIILVVHWHIPFLNLLISLLLYLKYFQKNDRSLAIKILLPTKIVAFLSFPIYYPFNLSFHTDNFPISTLLNFILFVNTIFLAFIVFNPISEEYSTNKSLNDIKQDTIVKDSYENTKMNENKQDLTLGDWVLIKFITYIPLVNLIMYCIWAFSSNSDKVKSNFAKASLIWIAIGTVLYILFLGSLISSFI